MRKSARKNSTRKTTPRRARRHAAAIAAMAALTLTGCGAPEELDLTGVQDCVDQVNKEIPCYHEAGNSGTSFYQPECMNACVNQKTIYAGDTTRVGFGLTQYTVPAHR